ncbi:MAG TPA: lysylphosphatidylglycerol synthase transmembrane domain-containing protein [Ktedonobacterales bacterium]
MRQFLRPRVLLPTLLSISLLAALFTFADIRSVGSAVMRFRPAYLLLFLALMVVYEAVRCVQWRQLLRASGIETTARTSAFTFLVGEMAKTLPMGQYLRNYLLRQTGGANIGQSVPATLITLLIEDAVALVGVLLLGIDGWGWLRPLIVVSALVFAVVIFVLYRLIVTARIPRRITTAPRFRALLAELKLFKASTAMLANPRLLVTQFLLGAVYLVLGAAALYSLLLGLGVTSVSFGQVVAISLFSLACGLLIPIPIDIGLIELSGTTALIAVGVSHSAAVSAMLLNRVLGGAAAVLIALVTMAVLHQELRAALRGRPAGPAPAQADPTAVPVYRASPSRPLVDAGESGSIAS